MVSGSEWEYIKFHDNYGLKTYDRPGYPICRCLKTNLHISPSSRIYPVGSLGITKSGLSTNEVWIISPCATHQPTFPRRVAKMSSGQQMPRSRSETWTQGRWDAFEMGGVSHPDISVSNWHRHVFGGPQERY